MEVAFRHLLDGNDNLIPIILMIRINELLNDTGYGYIYHMYKCNPKLVTVTNIDELEIGVKQWFHSRIDCENCAPYVMSDDQYFCYVKDKNIVISELCNKIKYVNYCNMIINSEHFKKIQQYFVIDIIDVNTVYAFSDIYYVNCKNINRMTDKFTYFIAPIETHKLESFKVIKKITEIECYANIFTSFIFRNCVLNGNELVYDICTKKWILRIEQSQK